MSLRKQPIGYYYNKLKAVFVFIIVFVSVFNSRDHFLSPSSISQLDIENSQHWSKYLDSVLAKKAIPAQQLHPFNPNFLNDYRAYRLRLASATVDRVTAYRSANQWINNAEEFKRITHISDTTLQRILPFLKFPKVHTRRQIHPVSLQKKDINQANLDDLKALYGIGPVLANRILEYKEKIQAFSDMGQIEEIYGLSQTVIDQLQQKYDVLEPVRIMKIPFNTASLSELAALPYLNYEEARWLVGQRTQQPESPLDSLLMVAQWPRIKVQRIKLYLY